MQKSKLKSGEYAAFLNYKNEYIGGCIFWNRDEKNNKVFWTSDWWIFSDSRDIKIEFYAVVENELKVSEICKVHLDISHLVKLGKENYGNIRIVSV